MKNYLPTTKPVVLDIIRLVVRVNTLTVSFQKFKGGFHMYV